MAFHSFSHLTKLILLPYQGNREVQKSHARSQGRGGGVRRVRSNPPQPEPTPTTMAIIRTRKGSRVVLNCCIKRVSRVYWILQCSNYQGGRGNVTPLQLCVPLLFVFPRGHYFVPCNDPLPSLDGNGSLVEKSTN